MQLITSDRPVTAEEALKKLKDGNSEYVKQDKNTGDVTYARRIETHDNGQKPYAVIIGCSDSRAIPEIIFNSGIGELFVIRVAGNVIENHQLGNVEYAVKHLGTRLVVVLGHDHCGAVDATIKQSSHGHIKYITDEIKKAIGNEKDGISACCMNVRHSVETIRNNPEIIDMQKENNLQVIGALYHIDTGIVDFDI